MAAEARICEKVPPHRPIKMLELLFESPITIGIVGAIATVATLYAWFQNGNPILFRTGLGIFVLTLLLVALSLFVQTDSERVRQFVLQTADELESNQFQKVIAKIHPQASGELQDAKLRLPDIRFQTARVKSFHSIDINNHRTGKSATVSMNVYLDVAYGGMEGRAPRWVQLSLEESDGKWYIVGYEQREPHYHLLNPQGRQNLDRRGR